MTGAFKPVSDGSAYGGDPTVDREGNIRPARAALPAAPGGGAGMVKALVDAARDVVASRSSSFKARNGREMGIEDDSGEKMWIVPFDEMYALEAALSAAPAPIAWQDVIAERCRQVEAEGWTSEHDDQSHDRGDLAAAASCYALAAACIENPYSQGDGVDVVEPPDHWPFDAAAWKISLDDPRRALVKAGALILAEIERLDRKEASR